MTMNIFLEDFQQVNIAYKRVLFATSTDQKEESQKKYEQFEKAHSEFMQKYFFYRPYAIKNDTLFNSDLQKVQSIIEEAQNLFVTSSLPDAYKKLEEIRPIWQAFFKRNNLSILTAALIDFQDVMDDLIDAASEGNTGTILTEYTPAHERLQIIEQELTGTDVQQVRKSLDKLYTEAKNQKLETLETTAQELHDNFVIINLRADEK